MWPEIISIGSLLVAVLSFYYATKAEDREVLKEIKSEFNELKADLRQCQDDLKKCEEEREQGKKDWLSRELQFLREIADNSRRIYALEEELRIRTNKS